MTDRKSSPVSSTVRFVLITFCGGPAGHVLDEVPTLQGFATREAADTEYLRAEKLARAMFEKTVAQINDPDNHFEWTDDEMFYVVLLELPRALRVRSSQEWEAALAERAEEQAWSSAEIDSMFRHYSEGVDGFTGPRHFSREELADRVLVDLTFYA